MNTTKPNKDCRHCQNLGAVRKGCFICDKASVQKEMREFRAEAQRLLTKALKLERGLGMTNKGLSN